VQLEQLHKFTITLFSYFFVFTSLDLSRKRCIFSPTFSSPSIYSSPSWLYLVGNSSQGGSLRIPVGITVVKSKFCQANIYELSSNAFIYIWIAVFLTKSSYFNRSPFSFLYLFPVRMEYHFGILCWVINPIAIAFIYIVIYSLIFSSLMWAESLEKSLFFNYGGHILFKSIEFIPHWRSFWRELSNF